MSKRQGRIAFYKDRRGKWRWRIVACNGRVLADSGQGYKRVADCRTGLVRAMQIASQPVPWIAALHLIQRKLRKLQEIRNATEGEKATRRV